MVRVVRGGRELLIPVESVAEYLKNGYSAIDDKGNVIQSGEPLTYEAAMHERNALKRRVAQLEAQLNELTAEKRKRAKKAE